MTRRLIIALVLLVPTVAWAHSFYPPECCSNQDCRPVPCEDISETPTGFVFDGVKFEKSAERPSQDRYCHVCIMVAGSTKRGLCLFTRQGS